MSRYSALDKITGQWGEIIWRKRVNKVGPYRQTWYTVYVGNRVVGQVSLMGATGWVAISHADPDDLLGLRAVHGFATRWRATEYLLNVGVRAPSGN